MLDKEQGSRLICVCVSDSLSVSLPPSLQAVSEDQQPKGKKGKEEKSKGNAKVREYWQEEVLGLRN